MAKIVLTNTRLFVVGVDLTAATNQVTVSVEISPEDTTTFASQGWKEVIGGLGESEVSAEGFWESGSSDLVDERSWVDLGGVGAWTAAPDGAAVGQLAYVGQLLSANYAVGGEVGAVAPYKLDGKGSGVVGRGQIAHPPGTPRTASGTGAALNLGATPAGRQLIASVHVLSVTSTLSVVPRIETDDSGAFTTPTTVATGVAFTAGNSPQGQFLVAAGPLTDAFQRVAWTATGAGSALFVAATAVA